MGGINAGKGFDFQTRYAACHVPVWLLEEAFHQLFFEGTGDIDIRYTEAGKSSRIHIQVKDHDVQPGELKTVIEQFSQPGFRSSGYVQVLHCGVSVVVSDAPAD